MFVLGTAGHIDHGKSSLVQALTGTDPDRLAEEKVRGMTIDLGFAWLKLPSGQEIGIVDVPGHERFVRNMLAGAGGIDIAMLVIAANESIMPQTREHLAILNLLGISHGLVALTKKDLVDDEWLELVIMEVEELLKPTTLADAPVVPVSAVTREGIPELLSTIEKLLVSAQPKRDKGRPRLPIDRVFTIAGAGTVVTGTLIDGSLAIGQEVELVPSGVKSRIRGLQAHKLPLEKIGPGSRAAVNLMNVTTDEAQRGEILTSPGWLKPTNLMSARLRLIPEARHPLPHNAERSIFILAAEAGVKIRLLDVEEIKPGGSGWAQLILDRPLPVLDGDHFVIRSATETLGGGVIIDVHARRLPRHRPEVIKNLEIREQGSPEELIINLLTNRKSVEMLDIIKSLPLETPLIWQTVQELSRKESIVVIGEGDSALIFIMDGWHTFIKNAERVLAEFHKNNPMRVGMLKNEFITRLKMGKTAASVMAKLQAAGLIIDSGLTVRLVDFTPHLDAGQQAKIDAFLKSLTVNPYAPPGDNIPEPDLLVWLVERRKVVKLGENVVMLRTAYEEMAGKVLARLENGGTITLAEARDMLGTSRKYAQALLEYLDGVKITRRQGDVRVKF